MNGGGICSESGILSISSAVRKVIPLIDTWIVMENHDHSQLTWSAQGRMALEYWLASPALNRTTTDQFATAVSRFEEGMSRWELLYIDTNWLKFRQKIPMNSWRSRWWSTWSKTTVKLQESRCRTKNALKEPSTFTLMLNCQLQPSRLWWIGLCGMLFSKGSLGSDWFTSNSSASVFRGVQCQSNQRYYQKLLTHQPNH